MTKLITHKRKAIPAATAPTRPLTEFTAPALPVFVAPAAVPVDVEDLDEEEEDERVLLDPVGTAEPV